MGHLACGLEDCAQGALGGQGEAVVSGFAVDKEAAALGRIVGGFSAGRVALLAADKQQPNPKSCRAQRLGGCYLSGENALGVADAATIKEFSVFCEGDVRRHGVQVRGKDQIGRLSGNARIDVPARAGGQALRWLLYRRLFYLPSAPCEKICQEIAHRTFMVCSGLDFAQLASQPDRVNGFDGRFSAQVIGHGAARIPYAVFCAFKNAGLPPLEP